MTMTLYAQGDLLLEQVADVNEMTGTPVPTANDGAVVLAEGEVTGHRHAFYGGAVLFRDESLARDMPTELYVGHVKIGEGGAVLRHEEHDPIELGAGTWRVRRQREYPAKESRRLVAD